MSTEEFTGAAVGQDKPVEPVGASSPAAMPQEQALSSAPEAFPGVFVVGVGNAGVNLVDALIRQDFPASSCAVVNGDAPALGGSLAAHKIAMDKQGRGMGFGGDPERGRIGAESCQAQIAECCKERRSVVIVCGMGGGAGTGGAPLVARLAKAAGALVVCLPVMPFECEGALRGRIAESGLVDLRKEADLVLPFRNDRVVSSEAAASVLDTFKSANEFIVCLLKCVVRAFTAGNVMGLPFSDICTLMHDRADLCLAAAAESAGAERAETVVARILCHPVFEHGSATLAEAETVAVNVVGGTTLGIAEINKIVDRVAQESASTPLVMGAAIHPEMGDRIAVMVLVDFRKGPQTEAPRMVSEQQARGSRMAEMPDMGPGSSRPPSRLVPPPPDLSQERLRQIHSQAGRGRKGAPRMRQVQLPLDIISRGRFDKSEPTILKGEDLDIPTYVRRGISLN